MSFGCAFSTDDDLNIFKSGTFKTTSSVAVPFALCPFSATPLTNTVLFPSVADEFILQLNVKVFCEIPSIHTLSFGVALVQLKPTGALSVTFT